MSHFTLNRVVLIGRLTRDPELRALPSGMNVCSLRLACNSSRRGADKVPYTLIGTGPGGYGSIIQGPTDRRLQIGDILLINTGAKYAGMRRQYLFQ